jgi:uncharacterized Zn finger protein
LRGLGRDELLRRLGSSPSTGKAATKARKNVASPAPAPETLSADPASFWTSGRLPDDFPGSVAAPRVSAALPKRLGNFPFWRGSQHFLETLQGIYHNAAGRGLDIFLGTTQSTS